MVVAVEVLVKDTLRHAPYTPTHILIGIHMYNYVPNLYLLHLPSIQYDLRVACPIWCVCVCAGAALFTNLQAMVFPLDLEHVHYEGACASDGQTNTRI